MAASDWLCQVSKDDFCTFVTIVHRDFWDENGYIDDQDITMDILKDIPKFDLMDLSESVYEYDGTTQEAKSHLNYLGLTVVNSLHY